MDPIEKSYVKRLKLNHASVEKQFQALTHNHKLSDFYWYQNFKTSKREEGSHQHLSVIAFIVGSNSSQPIPQRALWAYCLLKRVDNFQILESMHKFSDKNMFRSPLICSMGPKRRPLSSCQRGQFLCLYWPLLAPSNVVNELGCQCWHLPHGVSQQFQT